MSDISFFVPTGPFNINELSKDFVSYKDKILIKDLKTLDKANKNHISFLNSPDYINSAKKTKASVCLTTKNLKKYLPKNCLVIIVKNVLFSVAEISKKFYPEAHLDYPDKSLVDSSKVSSKFDSVTFGKNIFVGKNVKIGSNSIIGSNTIIEHDVQIGKNCVIGTNVTLRNVLIGKEVVVQDGSKIGVKGFGFIPIKNNNFKFIYLLGADNINIDKKNKFVVYQGSHGDKGAEIADIIFSGFMHKVLESISTNFGIPPFIIIA